MVIKLGGFKNFDIPISISPKEFFGVLLPGAIVTIVVYAVIKFGDTSWLKQLVEVIDGYWARWIAFGIVSVSLGYVLQIPAKSLNLLYDRTYLAWQLRKMNMNKQQRTIYNQESDQALVVIKRLAPAKAKPIEKLQGISEFFRSLTVIAAVVCGITLSYLNFKSAATAFSFSLAFYWLFCDKLWEATEASREAQESLGGLPKTV